MLHVVCDRDQTFAPPNHYVIKNIIMREMGQEKRAGVGSTERYTAALGIGPPGLYVISSRNAEPGMASR